MYSRLLYIFYVYKFITCIQVRWHAEYADDDENQLYIGNLLIRARAYTL